jgi:phosphatidylglycerol---prolipoprotein diacylglyceryl transferase
VEVLTQISYLVQPDIQIGPFLLHWYGLTIGIGIAGGLFFSEKVFGKIPWGILGGIAVSGIIGARLYHVIDEWNYYSLNLTKVISVTDGGLGIFGAFLGIAAYLYFYSFRSKLSFLRMADRIAIGAPLAQAIGRWGNFLNQEGFGPPTNLPWKIYITPSLRPKGLSDFDFFHPTFLYESILLFLLFVFFMKLPDKFKQKTGFVSGLYLVGYGIIRSITEQWRLDTWVINGTKIALVLSILSIVIGVIILTKSAKFGPSKNQ